jgi:GntR family transcriptional regulator/MocR family aminotransferase
VARFAKQSQLILRIDSTGGTLPRRVASALVEAMAEGRLADGDALPSTRVLGASLGVSRSVVVTAYEELIASGFLCAKPGGSTTVEIGAGRAARAGAFTLPSGTALRARSVNDRGDSVRYSLLPGHPDPGLIRQDDWNRAWKTAGRKVLNDADMLTAGFPGAADADFHLSRLKAELAGHIRRTRSVVADVEDILIFPGIATALTTLAPLLADRGPVAFEDPGYVNARKALQYSGVQVRPVAVDGQGLRVDLLATSDSAVYVTPAHQFPLGERMAVDRRAKLVEWAVDNDALILEDDYDGEFRYDVPPMPAVRAMNASSACVVYMGTISKSLHRSMRISWAVVPPQYREFLRQHPLQGAYSVNLVAAAALTEFISTGALGRHIVSAHRTYAARRQRFTKACSELLPALTPRGVDAGLHLVLQMDRTVDDAHIVQELHTRGLACAALSDAYLHPQTGQQSGLVCGYSALPESHAEDAVRLIREVVHRQG